MTVLAGCAQTHWVNKNAPVERLGQDTNYCKRHAAREAKRELNKEQRLDGSDIKGPSDTYGAQMTAYSSRKYETGIFDRCMMSKGYKKQAAP